MVAEKASMRAYLMGHQTVDLRADYSVYLKAVLWVAYWAGRLAGYWAAW